MTDPELFDYDLPEGLIATRPAPRREQSRLLTMERKTGKTAHHEQFSRIKEYFRAGDLLVLNDALVFPARLQARRKSGGKVEILLIRPADGYEAANTENAGKWLALVRAGGTIRAGESLHIPGQETDIPIEIEEDLDGGYMAVKFADSVSMDRILNAGHIPLPPYIRKARRHGGLPEEMPELDRERYQTVYASRPGAVAAPTAGMHFSRELLREIEEKGVEIRYLTLMVGPGTFMPVRTKSVEEHTLDPEYYTVPQATASAVQGALSESRRVVATGTTTVRVLEHLARTGRWSSHSGWTDMYIYPPFEFRVTGALITNFHLPGSTLLMLVSAFAGRQNILAAYAEAIEHGYSFYSYGDATFLY